MSVIKYDEHLKVDEYPLLKNNGRMSVEADGQTLSVIKYVEHSMVDEYPLFKNNGRMSVEAICFYFIGEKGNVW